MTPEDQCFAELVAIIDSNDANAAALAGGSVEQYLVALAAAPDEAVLALGALQVRLIGRGGTSKTRADVLDVVGEHVERLLDAKERGSP